MDRAAPQLAAFEAGIADALRHAREARGVSQTALANELGHDQAVVSRIEAGQRKVTVEDLFRWGEALGIKASEAALLAAEVWVVTAERPPSLWRTGDD